MAFLNLKTSRSWIVLFFFFSGFCGLLYQLVWLRLAFASFGVNTPVLSVVLSVFMAGLALGSWLGGRLASRWSNRSAMVPIAFYAAAEILIGVGAFAVPFFFSRGETFLLSQGSSDSTRYLFLSAVVILFSLLPWCLCMGTTFPFMMAYIRKTSPSADSFSFLYTANVLGAMTGVFITAAALIEWLGFHGTLRAGAFLNFSIGLAGLMVGSRSSTSPAQAAARRSETPPRTEPAVPFLAILFLTGFVCMAMEVLWTRDFTIILRTQVYSYASLLFIYLLSTFYGSWLYRRHQERAGFSTQLLIQCVFGSALFTVLINDPRIHTSVVGVLLSIVPFCLALGYLTPKLVDQYSAGDPAKASLAYAVNTVGCILGPLTASYLLLPYLNIKTALILLSLLFIPFFLGPFLRQRVWTTAKASAVGLGVLLLSFGLYSASDYERFCGSKYPSYVLRRDYAATVISAGEKMEKHVYVNGISMTGLCQVTKSMAHIPLAYLPHKPQSALIICFGMGTTYRSMLSWGIDTTVVELVPSVIKSFGYFFTDADQIARLPNAHAVADDGRRFLRRTSQTFDVITLDPPPPLEAAGSSLLYSVEFYELAKRHLNEGGILQQWIPGGDNAIWQAAVNSLAHSFPYIGAFPMKGFGCHLMASSIPLPFPTVEQLAKKMPPLAVKDLAEWSHDLSPERFFKNLLERETPVTEFFDPDSAVMITDDRPFNEYFCLRHIHFMRHLRQFVGLPLEPK